MQVLMEQTCRLKFLKTEQQVFSELSLDKL